MEQNVKTQKSWKLVLLFLLLVLLTGLIWNNVKTGTGVQIYLYGEEHRPIKQSQ